MKYLPFLTGTYSTAPGLVPVTKQEQETDKLIFQTDGFYSGYLDNKALCRQENMSKYYLEHNAPFETIRVVNDYIVQQLQKEHPAYFDYEDNGDHCILINLQSGELVRWNKATMQLSNNRYLSLFDALCCQVQEDLAVCQLQDTSDWLAAVHLCAPNHWAPQDKIGKPFDAVHAPVPGMEKTIPHYFKMLQSVISKGPFTRYAWGISADNRLNHHPVAPAGINQQAWLGRKINDASRLFIRTERQNLVGFPQVNAFLFTIRTYFYEVSLLQDGEKKALWSAVRSMSPEALAYKGLTGITDFLATHLFEG
jgi:dimethylamine monooxygenase subunit A